MQCPLADTLHCALWRDGCVSMSAGRVVDRCRPLSSFLRPVYCSRSHGCFCLAAGPWRRSPSTQPITFTYRSWCTLLRRTVCCSSVVGGGILSSLHLPERLVCYQVTTRRVWCRVSAGFEAPRGGAGVKEEQTKRLARPFPPLGSGMLHLVDKGSRSTAFISLCLHVAFGHECTSIRSPVDASGVFAQGGNTVALQPTPNHLLLQSAFALVSCAVQRHFRQRPSEHLPAPQVPR